MYLYTYMNSRKWLVEVLDVNCQLKVSIEIIDDWKKYIVENKIFS